MSALCGDRGQDGAVLAARKPADPPERIATVRSRRAAENALQLSFAKGAGSSGYVRHGHGDLHWQFVETRGRPGLLTSSSSTTPSLPSTFSTISPSCSWISARGLPAHANAALNAFRKRAATRHLIGLAALPLFLSMRAMIRAKVGSAAGGTLSLSCGRGARPRGLLCFCSHAIILNESGRIGGLSGQRQVERGASVAPQSVRFRARCSCGSDVECVSVRRQRRGAASSLRVDRGGFCHRLYNVPELMAL